MSTDAASLPDLDSLPDDIDALKATIVELIQALTKSERLNEKLQHQLEHLLRWRYGQRSEKLHPDQGLLFDLLETAMTAARTEPPPAQPETAAEDQEPKKAKRGGRSKLPAQLPRRRVEHDLPDDQKTCPCCGETLAKIGEETSEQIEYVPASLVVLEHARFKYACKNCQDHVTTSAKLPAPIERGLPGPGMLAYVAASKYCDHLPLYRLEGIFKRHGLELSRSTMCDWMARVAELVEPITKRMRELVLESTVIQTDDTPVPVQDADHPKGTRTGRLWTYLGDGEHPYTLFDYTPTRSREGPQAWLDGYRGYLQADAFAGYDVMFKLDGMTEVACMAHARRKFFEAKSSDALRAHQALAMIGRLYDVERAAKEEAEQRANEGKNHFAELTAIRMSLRADRSRSALATFFAWLDAEQPKVLPKSPMGQAIAYALSNQSALRRYCESGVLDIDNNAAERAIKLVVIGRKNWLNVGSDAGGRTAATIFSITATCKRLGLDPFAYLRDLLDAVSTHPANRLDELLPDRWLAARQPAAAT